MPGLKNMSDRHWRDTGCLNKNLSESNQIQSFWELPFLVESVYGFIGQYSGIEYSGVMLKFRL